MYNVFVGGKQLMNMIDYLKWRGDLSFKTSPFNNVDNLLCSYLAYCDLSEVVSSDDKKISLKDACDKYFQTHIIEKNKNDLVFIYMAPTVFKEMANSDRYKDAMLSYCVREVNDSKDIQFSAIRIDLDKDNTYLAFCGTDDSIVGWKEDFQLCYKKANAQQRAVEYIKLASRGLKHFYVGGHSKGGNLAIYGSLKSSKYIQNKITRIYNNDGPGLSESLFDQQLYDNIKDKCLRIVPEFSFFGQMFAQDCQQIIIKSNQKALMQHDATSWQVEGTDFVYGQQLDKYSSVINEAINVFFKDVDNSEREQLTNELFDAIEEAGIKTLSDISKNGLPVVIKLINNLRSVDEQAKETISKLIKSIVDQSSQHITDEVEKLAIVEEIRERLSKIKK